VSAVPEVTTLTRAARRIRATCVQLAHDARKGHLKSALSCVDILVALYHGGWLRVSPAAPQAPARDRFYLSKGHGCTSLYAVLADRGFIDRELLAHYGETDAALQSHPCRHALPVLECTSGSLGHGVGIAAGALYGLRLAGNHTSRGVVLVSDGECNEGSTWEAAMFAAAQRLERLVVIVDENGIQAVGRSAAIMGGTSLEEKFRAFGFGARTVDGHDFGALRAALDAVPFTPGHPSAIVARTKSGAGVSFMEDDVLWHYRVPSDEDLARALAELSEPPVHRG
jgi:transketolase